MAEGVEVVGEAVNAVARELLVPATWLGDEFCVVHKQTRPGVTRGGLLAALRYAATQPVAVSPRALAASAFILSNPSFV